MIKIYCIVCDKCRKFKNVEKHQVFLLFTISVVINIKKVKEDESIKMLKILGLIINIKEYQKTYTVFPLIRAGPQISAAL